MPLQRKRVRAASPPSSRPLVRKPTDQPWPSSDVLRAVNHEHASADIPRIVGGEVSDGGGQVLRRSAIGAAGKARLANDQSGVLPFERGNGGAHAGIDLAGAYGVEADALAGILHRQRLRQSDERG